MSQATTLEIYQRATRASLQEMASTLVRVLGRAMVAYIVSVRNPKTISRWAKGDVASVRDRYSLERLLALYQVVSFLEEYEGDNTIKLFMFGMNPGLNNRSPASEILRGNYDDVMGAAKAMVAGDYQ